MFEKYWRQWRSVYIRRHVLNLMDRRDSKRLMSVVSPSVFPARLAFHFEQEKYLGLFEMQLS